MRNKFSHISLDNHVKNIEMFYIIQKYPRIPVIHTNNTFG